MKLQIIYKNTNKPYGGSNQFLKALKERLIELDLYENSSEKSEVFIFNSHNEYDEAIKLKKLFPEKIFIHRVDGPMKLYNNMSDNRDDMVYKLNKISNGTIFQSKYSFDNNIKLGMRIPEKYSIIGNFCDNNIFKTKKTIRTNSKIRIISTSFSTNPKKGFATYKFLDDYLDFSKYEYVFAGNSSVNFRNIRMLGRLDSKQLALELYNSDIYITASENDPCSNSLIEAQTVGLPTIALNSGGHSEIINKNGELYELKEELLEKIHKISDNLSEYFSQKSKIEPNTIAKRYIEFIRSLQIK